MRRSTVLILFPHLEFPAILFFQTYRKQRQIDAMRQGSTNSTSRIDSVARILFPVNKPHNLDPDLDADPHFTIDKHFGLTHGSNVDCLSFVMCLLLLLLIIGFFSFFFCCGH